MCLFGANPTDIFTVSCTPLLGTWYLVLCHLVLGTLSLGTLSLGTLSLGTWYLVLGHLVLGHLVLGHLVLGHLVLCHLVLKLTAQIDVNNLLIFTCVCAHYAQKACKGTTFF